MIGVRKQLKSNDDSDWDDFGDAIEEEEEKAVEQYKALKKKSQT